MKRINGNPEAAKPRDMRRMQLKHFYTWLVALDPADMAALAEHVVNTRIALAEIEQWFTQYHAALKKRPTKEAPHEQPEW